MTILSQFLLRLAFGLAIGMAITSPRKVSSGFFRNHLYVTLGLATLAALVSGGRWSIVMWLSALAAILSYAGSVSWLYEAKRLGRILICLVAYVTLLAAWMATATHMETVHSENMGEVTLYSVKPLDNWRAFSTITSGLVLGVTFAAMLRGQWSLNAPGMDLAPLLKLLNVAAIAVCGQAIISGTGLIGELSLLSDVSLAWLLFVLLRWSFGIFAVLVLLWMAWQTLKIPNTQSATGILYVAVIGVFVGELTALLLSAESAFPL